MDPHLAAAQINAPPLLKTGSLRFWGEWFGKPYDNCHRITMCRAITEALVLEFDGGEVLTVTEPEGLMVGSDVITIHNALSVRWEWFYYGRPAVAEHLYFYEFWRRGLVIEARTNVEWYQRTLTPSTKENAVEIL